MRKLRDAPVAYPLPIPNQYQTEIHYWPIGKGNGKLIHYPSPNQLGTHTFTHNVYPINSQKPSTLASIDQKPFPEPIERNMWPIEHEINPTEVLPSLDHRSPCTSEDATMHALNRYFY
ncbi:hypothetical protein PtB15_11B315 [Puccinia triticina]|nr:hypothetical protein PtB15_11B315 [Puccinia triticina]